MCIDQQQFVTYDPAFDPRVSTTKPPPFDVKDMVYNWPNPTGAQVPGLRYPMDGQLRRVRVSHGCAGPGTHRRGMQHDTVNSRPPRTNRG